MYHITSRDSVTAIIRGRPYTVASDHPRYQELVSAITANDEDKAFDIVTAATEIAAILATFGDVKVFGGHVTYRGATMHNYLVEKIVEAVANHQDPAPLGRFLDNVMKNPDPRAAEDLYSWCEKAKMPLTTDGCIIGYKIVNNDFTDCYTGRFDFTPGKTAEMRREDCDPNPDQTCSRGLHFCSAGYLPAYGPSNKRVILVKVNPADVVAFPRDYNLAKARCCKQTSMEEIPAATAATYFDGVTTSYYDGATVDLASPLTPAERIEAIEEKVGVELFDEDLPLAQRLDAIDRELGLPEIEPLIERIRQAERAAGIN